MPERRLDPGDDRAVLACLLITHRAIVPGPELARLRPWSLTFSGISLALRRIRCYLPRRVRGQASGVLVRHDPTGGTRYWQGSLPMTRREQLMGTTQDLEVVAGQERYLP